VKLGSATKIHGRLGQRAQEAKDPVARLRRGPCYRGCADRSFYPCVGIFTDDIRLQELSLQLQSHVSYVTRPIYQNLLQV